MDSDQQALNSCVDKLRSSDVKVRNAGVDEALSIGVAVIPFLLPLLDEPDDGVRAQATYSLAQLATPEIADRLLGATNDASEQVRAYAAEGLARIQHPEALNACVKTLNDAPDLLHADITPAVKALAAMGMTAIPPLLDLLMNEDSFTRLHAQRALDLVLSRLHGFKPGRGFPSSEAEEMMHAEWRANGDYDSSQEARDRAAAVEKWRQWLQARSST